MTESGIIFNLQKFSLNDGPGIRTVVFFKGCPLRCQWCANPESQSPKAQILWQQDNCLHCGSCIRCCPNAAIQSANAGGLLVDCAACDACGLCQRQCPGQALSLAGKSWTVAEVLQECLKDKDFYDESDGGVTLSGGEALMQPDFAIALLKALKAEHISTAIETTGIAPPEVLERALPLIDLWLFDLKHWDEKKHREGTGVSNRLVLENMRRAIQSGAKVLPRLPVIPGYNSELSDAACFLRLLRELEAARVQLLPFHQFGEGKYDMLGAAYAYRDVPALHEDGLTAYQQVFLEGGVDAFF